MPGHSTHLKAGTISGAAAGFLAARAVTPDRTGRDTAVGALGGAIGGTAPDLLEPATSPAHRDLCHSLIFTTALSVGLYALWRGKCREQALACEARATSVSDPSAREREEKAAAMWRDLGAFALGVAAGYASHVLLDSQTPRSVPLLGRGL